MTNKKKSTLLSLFTVQGESQPRRTKLYRCCSSSHFCTGSDCCTPLRFSVCLSSEHGPLLSVPDSVCRQCRAVQFSRGLVITYNLRLITTNDSYLRMRTRTQSLCFLSRCVQRLVSSVICLLGSFSCVLPSSQDRLEAQSKAKESKISKPSL